MSRTSEEKNQLVESYLRYLTDPDPQDETWDAFHELAMSDPRGAWEILLDVSRRCPDDDLAMLGAGAVQHLLFLHPELAPEFEAQIRSDNRFLKAFQYVAMTGVPLAVQQRLNGALADRGVDPKYLVEYDEEIE